MAICKVEGKIVGWKIDKQSKINIDLENRPETITKSTAPKRPEALSCDIKKVKIQGEQWTIFIGMLNNQPYEIFGGLSKYIDIPNKYKTGKILKRAKSQGISVYTLEIGDNEDKMIIKDIANIFENTTNGSFSRMISLSMRHGIPVQYIVEQLQKDKYSEMTSYSRVIARVLKTYIKDGTVSSSERDCPSCKEKNALVYQEGCLICKSCGYSRCS